MRIEILRSVMIAGEPVEAGSLLDVSQGVAYLLIGSNKARKASEPVPEPASEPEPEAPKRSRKAAPAPSAEEA